MIDRVLVAFLAGSALLGTLLFAELEPSDGSGGESVIQPAPRRVETRPAPPRPQAPRTEELIATVLDRPLFSPTRRPADKAKTEQAADPELPNMRLTGIIIEPEHHLAIFAVPGNKPLVRSEGETINEWRLDSIAPREVSLTGPTGTTTLAPKSDPSLMRPKAPVQAAANPAQPGVPGQPPGGGPRPPFPVVATPQPRPTANPPSRATNPAAAPARRPNPQRPQQ